MFKICLQLRAAPQNPTTYELYSSLSIESGKPPWFMPLSTENLSHTDLIIQMFFKFEILQLLSLASPYQYIIYNFDSIKYFSNLWREDK